MRQRRPTQTNAIERTYSTKEIAEETKLKPWWVRQMLRDGHWSGQKWAGTQRWYCTESQMQKIRNKLVSDE